MFIDSHAHFDIIQKETDSKADNLIKALKDNNIKHAVQVSISADGLNQSYKFALRYKNDGIFFTAGIHPSSTAGEQELTFLDNNLSEIVKKEKNLLFGIGECGLDYYRMKQTKEMQIASFQHQILLAKKYNLPLIIHIRDAMADALKILRNHSPLRGIMHCFSGNKKSAKEALDLGLYISYAGNVTYRKAFNLHESSLYVPLDRLLLETDAPFLTPEPLRGDRNKPEYVIHTYNFMAKHRKIPVLKLEEQIYENFTGILNKNNG